MICLVDDAGAVGDIVWLYGDIMCHSHALLMITFTPQYSNILHSYLLIFTNQISIFCNNDMVVVLCLFHICRFIIRTFPSCCSMKTFELRQVLSGWVCPDIWLDMTWILLIVLLMWPRPVLWWPWDLAHGHYLARVNIITSERGNNNYDWTWGLILHLIQPILQIVRRLV